MKWGVLLSLADRYGANHILQVLYYRQLEWPHLEVDGEATPLPAAVVRHFRQATAITAIEARVPVDVVADLFEQRDQYLQVVITRIRDRLMTPGIVFLDPDTGLQPTIASRSCPG